MLARRTKHSARLESPPIHLLNFVRQEFKLSWACQHSVSRACVIPHSASRIWAVMPGQTLQSIADGGSSQWEAPGSSGVLEMESRLPKTTIKAYSVYLYSL